MSIPARARVKLALVSDYWLELWASLRILPLQILHVAMHFGWRPELRHRLDARLAVILAGDDPRWRHARSPAAH